MQEEIQQNFRRPSINIKMIMLQRLASFYHRLYVYIALNGLPVKRTKVTARSEFQMYYKCCSNSLRSDRSKHGTMMNRDTIGIYDVLMVYVIL